MGEEIECQFLTPGLRVHLGAIGIRKLRITK
jgi:hypothetical protein